MKSSIGVDRASIVTPAYPNQRLQEAENARAAAALSELLENAITVADNYLAYTDGRLPALGAKGKSLKEAQKEFQTRYRHEQPCRWTEDAVMERCAQKLSKEQIRELASRPTLDTEDITAALRQLNTSEQLPRGRCMVLKESLVPLRQHQGPTAVQGLADTLVALYDVQHVDAAAAVREELAEMEPSRQRQVAKVNDAQAVYNAAVARGDVVEVERAHRHLIAARYELIVLYAKRLLHLSSAEDDTTLNSFGDELRRAQSDAEDAGTQFTDEKTALLAALQEDMARCDATAAEERKAHEDAEVAYTAQEAERDGELSSIVDRKLVLIDELRERARELSSLMERQKILVRDGMDAKRAEAQRVTAFAEFMDIEQQHRTRLERCRGYCGACEPVAKAIAEYVGDMTERLPTDSVKGALREMADEEAKRFMEAYSTFVFTCGDLTVRKTHRLDTLERQARLTTHNRDTAMESLDPNLGNYRADLNDLLAQMKAVEGVVNALNATQDAGEQVFESVEGPVRAMCARSGKTFVHPLQEFGHKSIDERNRFVNRSLQYVEGEEREVTHKKTQLSEMKAAMDQENSALTQAIASADAHGTTPAAAITN